MWSHWRPASSQNLKGRPTFTIGATKAYGTRDGSKYYWDHHNKLQIVEINGRESPLGSIQNRRSWKKTREAWRAVHNRDGSLKEKDCKRGTEIIKGTKQEKHYKDIRFRKFRDHKTLKRDASGGGGTRAHNSQYGAFTFNYEQKLNLKKSFTAKEFLFANFTAGNFCDKAFAVYGASQTKLSTAPCAEDVLGLGHLYYSFPLKMMG